MITIVRQYVCQYYTQCLCKVRIVIMISAAMVNTQTHTHRRFVTSYTTSLASWTILATGFSKAAVSRNLVSSIRPYY